MTNIAFGLQEKGYTLLSGGADGADTAFELGAGKLKEIYLPWNKFNGHVVDNELYFLYKNEATEIAQSYIPHWNELTPGAKKLHSRNVHQVLGKDLKNPVDFLICWTKNGQDVGGTRTAILIARRHNIKVFNLAKGDFE